MDDEHAGVDRGTLGVEGYVMDVTQSGGKGTGGTHVLKHTSTPAKKQSPGK